MDKLYQPEHKWCRILPNSQQQQQQQQQHLQVTKKSSSSGSLASDAPP